MSVCLASKVSSNQRPSRKNSNPTPWSAITNDTTQQAAIQQAAHDAKLVTVSDWSKATSDEYMKVEEESNLDIL